ncbi:MAG TPA: sugar phosphate isomerase/epimerase [Bryobacteraceae bacterium]|jgi:sugar phosphate isomerase/epimerase|nr:sugar phosphate isomerase/epimerase [Bryobacteraceae bacterium]
MSRKSEFAGTRRGWLKSAAAAGFLSAAAGADAAAQEYRVAGADLKLGIASYSFRKFSRAEAIQMTKKLGTPYLNVKEVHLAFDSTPEQIDAARQEFANAGLILVGVGNVSFARDDEADIRRKFEYAKRLGVPLMVCAPTLVTLPKLEPYVKEFDIKIAIHNHGPEDKVFPTPQSALKQVQNMDPRCGLCIDVGHTARTGVDVAEAIAEAGPRLLDMHVKDLADLMVKESQVPVGTGKMPFPQIFRQLIKMKYQGSVNLEYEIEESNPLPGMQVSMAYMRGVLAGESLSAV